jgi:hypothetical protein
METTSADKIIHIRSQDCLFLNNVYSFSLNESINCEEGEELNVEVLNTSIPYSFFNVNGTNKFLSIREAELDGSNPVDWNLQLIEGNYNAITFLSAFQTAINLQSIALGKSYNYSVAYQKLTNTVLFTLNSSNAKTEFLFRTGILERFDCQYLLGFSFEDFSFDSNNTLTSNGSVNMSPYDAVYIYSNLGIINQYDTLSKNLSNILIKIPINSLPFSYIQYTNDARLVYKSSRTVIQSIELETLDFDADPIDLRFANWFISIRFFFTKKDVFKVPRPTDLIPVSF